MSAHELVISGLRAAVAGTEILKGIDLTIRSGSVHAIMGPNGSGKSTLSHVLMGKPGYEVTGGSVTLDGEDLLALPTWRRAQAGLFLAMQYPTEVPGVSVQDVVAASFEASGRRADHLDDALLVEADRIGFDHDLLRRSLNVDMSGGEKKRSETMQLGVMQPAIAILDELDSGLDVDALRQVSRRVEAATSEDGLGVLVITHYSRLLKELKADHIHVLAGGLMVDSGGPELAEQLEVSGYAAYGSDEKATLASTPSPDPFGDPFGDPLA